MDTLLLNQSMQPVDWIPWQKAVKLLFLNKVEVIEQYEDRDIRSITVCIKMPAIVRFIRAFRPNKFFAKFSKENIYKRDGGTCQYCAIKIRKKEATLDHVMPKSRGGSTSFTNIVLCCGPCGQKKGARTPDEAGMVLLNKPVRPSSSYILLKDNEIWVQFINKFKYEQSP